MNGDDERKSQYNLDPLQQLMSEAEKELAGPGTIEFRKLFLAISRIASHMESERGTLHRLIARVDRQEKILTGDERAPGLKGSVDLLNDEMKRRRKMQWMVLSAVVTLIVMKCGELLLKK